MSKREKERDRDEVIKIMKCKIRIKTEIKKSHTKSL